MAASDQVKQNHDKKGKVCLFKEEEAKATQYYQSISTFTYSVTVVTCQIACGYCGDRARASEVMSAGVAHDTDSPRIIVVTWILRSTRRPGRRF